MTTDPHSAVVTIPSRRRGGMRSRSACRSGNGSRRPWKSASPGMTTGSCCAFRRPGWGGPLYEEPWIFADLTGKNLELRYPQNLEAMVATFREKPIVASVYAVRLMPMRAEDVALVQEMRHTEMVYINDGFGIFYNAKTPGPHIVRDALASFAGGGLGHVRFREHRRRPRELSHRARHARRQGRLGFSPRGRSAAAPRISPP